MERRTPATQEPKPHQSRRRPGVGMTTQQGLILFLIGVLNVILFGLGAYVVLSLQAPSQERQAQQPVEPFRAVSTMPPTWTPPPSLTPPQAGINRLPACVPPGSRFSRGIVSQVVDRQTLEILVDGETQQIGFAGVVFPDLANAPADLAEMTVQQVVGFTEGHEVFLVDTNAGSDDGGRQLSYLFAGDIFLNAELLRMGMAVVDPAAAGQPCAIELQQAEQAARSSRTGIWQPALVPTSTFIPFVTVAPAACDCSIRYECSDFLTHESAQVCFNACNDYNSRLDEDRDGLACENLP